MDIEVHHTGLSFTDKRINLFCFGDAMKKILIATFLIFAFLLFSNQAMAEMYKWVDKNGVIHFSDTPPIGEKR